MVALSAAAPGDDGPVGLSRDGDTVTVTARGRWTRDVASAIDAALDGLASEPLPATARFDLTRLERLDTAGAWLIHRTECRLRAAGVKVERDGPGEAQALILDAVGRVDTEQVAPGPQPSMLVVFLNHLGSAVVGIGREALSLLSFFGMLAVKTARAVVQPRRVRRASVFAHMEATGLDAMPIVGLLSFLIGVVLAYQGADQLAQFGAEIFTVNLVGIAVLREMGILITAIIVAGRSGSAFTAQIGTMKVNQEVDAMETLGLDPVDMLVLPRVAALLVTLPMLAFFADLMGLLGGAVMINLALGIPFASFLDQLRTAVDPIHLFVGLVKAPVFAFTIAMVGCYQGLKVSGSAESVGRLTTQSVVQSIFLVMIIDAVFSIVFSSLGI
ncbi:MAG: MlaE family lipid ABC transporter permease subunit [Azospirillaceae bacterium]